MNFRGFAARCLIAAAALGALTAGAAAQDEKVFKLGVVTFLSGPAAESFGKPAWNGAKTVIDALNAGSVLKPYDKVGFGGLKIEVDLIDETGGATKQVQELRNAYERDHVDAVLGYIGSGDCLAVAPAAEELKKFLVLMDCGTPRIFEENKFKYVFRSAAHGGMDNIAMARYLVKRTEGRRCRRHQPGLCLGPGFLEGFQGQLGATRAGSDGQGRAVAEIRRRPIRHRDLDAAAGKAQPGLFQPLGRRSPGVRAAGRAARLDQGPARGAERLRPRAAAARQQDAGRRHHRRARLQRPVRGARARSTTGSLPQSPRPIPASNPVQPQYRGAQGVLALKTAVEKAMAANGGKKPTTEEMVAAMTGQEWDAPSGHIKMALGDGHQAIQSNAAGRTKWDADAKMVKLVDIEHFPAECVNPPAGMKAEDWIAEGFPGAKCN